MASVTITLTDAGDEVDVQTVFEPHLEEQSPSHRVAAELLDVLASGECGEMRLKLRGEPQEKL